MKFTTRELCLAALFTALVFVMTYVPKIPIPLGYAHLGNAAVFLGVILMDKQKGAIAGAIGSALADLIGGFAIWILPTLLIKYIMALIFGSLYSKNSQGGFDFTAKSIIGLAAACVWMVAAYTLFGAFLYDSLEAGLASTPGLAMEGLMNAVVFLIFAKACQKVNLKG